MGGERICIDPLQEIHLRPAAVLSVRDPIADGMLAWRNVGQEGDDRPFTLETVQFAPGDAAFPVGYLRFVPYFPVQGDESVLMRPEFPENLRTSYRQDDDRKPEQHDRAHEGLLPISGGEEQAKRGRRPAKGLDKRTFEASPRPPSEQACIIRFHDYLI